MPRRFRKVRKGRKGRKGRRQSGPPMVAEKKQSARIIETLETKDLSGNIGYAQDFTLSQFPRANLLASSFQWYRAKRVTYSFEPLYNTFQDGAGAASKPYMYVVMNRGQQLLGGLYNALAQFQSAGARAQPLSSTKRLVYTPNWCSPGILAVRTTTSGGGVTLYDFAGEGTKPEYGWLATPPGATVTPADGIAVDQFINNQGFTNPGAGQPWSTQGSLTNNVIYNGHYVYFDQKVVGQENTEPICRCIVTVEWEFKGAKNNLGITPRSPLLLAPPPPSST